ncbi:chymotrypsinogen A-like [Tubulanus polymorphus]|uniref:chymotrypsinogen A-like n=1 Tax=Tubulanus polymorphus TaxID=672921 RepID=UPI003DA55BAE
MIGRLITICILFVGPTAGLNYCNKLGLKCVPYADCPSRSDGKPNYYPHVYGYCDHYTLICCKGKAKEKPPTTFVPRTTAKPSVTRPVVNPDTTDTKLQSCGISNSGDWRIISGSASKTGQWPWQVSLIFRDDHTCGGTLVNEDTIVTAAHCVAFSGGMTPYNWRVVIGETRRITSAKRYRVRSIEKHSGYRKFRGNDLAIMKLAEKVFFDQTKIPACLPENTPDPISGSVCYVSGFGQTYPYNEFAPSSSRLLHVDVKIVSRSTCTTVYGPRSIDSGTICAGGHSSKNACKGDSGGPLVCERNGRWFLHGVVSFGNVPCGQRGNPGVYTRVSSYLRWIKARM